MIQSSEIHNKIIQFIQNRGPSLPIQIAKQLNMSSLFISAFLAELVNEQKLKMSNLKVGGSKLYFIPGQEQSLENFHNHLPPKEIEAFRLLKEKKVLKDNELEPAIRVALRSIRDFSMGFKHNEEIFWRYLTIPEQEAFEIITPVKIEKIIPIEIKKEISEEEAKIKEIIKKPKESKKIKEISETRFNNPLVVKPKELIKKEKIKSEFVQTIIQLIKEKYQIIEEKEFKTKEYTCITQVKTELGPINFLTKAKDKKTISESDVKNLLSEAQSMPLPALIIYTGDLSKKAKEYIEKYPSILKAKKLSQSSKQ
ncbi:MAG: hypothetical protein WC438_02605 [Candidatus Pacearchaeota archaeon]